jgi:hypothetical protein
MVQAPPHYGSFGRDTEHSALRCTDPDISAMMDIFRRGWEEHNKSVRTLLSFYDIL